MKTKLFIVLLLFFAGTTLKAQQSVVTGSKPGWYKIAEKSVDFRVDRDHVTVLGADRFKAIQLRVTDAHIRMEDLNVQYEIPGYTEVVKEDVQVRSDFKPGERTRIIYLQYPCLKLKDIEFFYRTVPNWRFEKAHVEVYGMK